ncbi:unnamed protein product [Schistocephalus solidus]|uniref:Apple domain-containing protein n=1 Tax=Schistocephalus solidus TaxID=70667 RepID=A0A183TU10_SCHSO|nr:unnamed protein product [Schistocephalus solidus]
MWQVSVYDEQKTEYWPLKYFHAPGETDAFAAMIECLDSCYVGDLTEEATAKFCMAYAKNCISYKYFGRWGYDENFELHLWCIYACNFVDKVTDQINKAYYVHRDSYYSGRMFFKPKELGDAAECREICANKAGDLTEEATAECCVGYAQKCSSYEYFGRWGYYEYFDLHLRCIYACNFVDKGKPI